MKNSITDGLFEKLQTAYTKGEFAKGAELIVQNNQIIPAPQYHFVLGTFYAKAQNFPVARFHLEKAGKLGYLPTEVHQNLKYVMSQMPNERAIEQDSGLTEKLWSETLSMSLGTALGISLLMILMVFLISWRNKLQSSRAVILGVVLSLTPMLYCVVSKGLWSQAVVLSPGTLFEGPSRIFSPGNTLNPGLKVIIKRPVNGWGLILSPSEYVGWVPVDQLGVL